MSEDRAITLTLQKDVYRLSKEELQNTLTKFNIKYRDSDTVADLRPIIADLKSYIKHNLTEEKKHILRKLLGRQYLTNVELIKYPGLLRVQNFIEDRDNLYDTAEDRTEEAEYEEIHFQLGPEQVQMADRKEKLPLISAGTYHGLPTENPNEFLDRYELAALSNHWQEETKLNLFPAHLTGTALSWYKHHIRNNANAPVNWNNLKETFVSTFTPAAQATNLQNILDKKIQGKDQPVIAYYFEILTLCRRYDPEITDKRIAQYIIQGLKPEFCDKIVTEPCDTLEDLEKSLKKVELQLEIKAANREKHSRLDTHTPSQSNISVGNRTEEIHILQEEIKSLKEQINNMAIHNNPQQQRQPSTSYQQQRVNNDRGMRNYTHSAPPPTHRGPAGSTAPWQGRRYNTNMQSHYRGRNMFCKICKRNNHDTHQCRFRSYAPVHTNTRKYCDHCKMTNHSREECFRLKPKMYKNDRTQQKN